MARPIVPLRRRFRRSTSLLRVAIGALLCAGLALLPLLAAHGPAERGERAMVVTPDEQATRVGVEILRGGGNAIDAAIAIHFALAVTFPRAGNLGGGGFLLYRDAEGKHHALDFRERAPAALRPEIFLDEDGRPLPGLSLKGGLSVGVPGSVAGLAEMHRRWGSRPWAELVRPAIALAQDGFVISPYLARSFERYADKLDADPEARRLFRRDGRPYSAGERLVQKELAGSLRRIAKGGARAFYSGALGSAVVRTVRDAGGVMTQDDLQEYRVEMRAPIEGRYRGYRVVSFPPPSSGGVALLQILTMLESFDLGAAGSGSSLCTHLIAEAERRAFADRSRWLADPDHYEVPLAGLLDADYLRERASSIDPERASPSAELFPGRPARPDSPDTLHFSVADGLGRVVALTTTLNASFGNGIVARGTGILLNNEIDDFSLAPGVPNTYGLLGGEANALAAGKRPLSSMTPTIVEPGEGGARPVLVLGSPGGGEIITAVLQVLVNVIDHGMTLREAVESPRFHHQWQPDQIRYEQRAFPADVLRNLSARGHDLQQAEGAVGNVNAIGLADDGAWLGAADPRREGSAAGF
jgi:gamma-glutamyltranspeptidase/glutathione hydrolase